MMLPIEEIVGGVLTLAAGIAIAWDRIGKWKATKSEKDMRTDLLDAVARDRDAVVRQRDYEAEKALRLQTKNLELEERLRVLASEVEGLNNRLILLSELNTRLAASLDLTRKRLVEYLGSGTRHQ